MGCTIQTHNRRHLFSSKHNDTSPYIIEAITWDTHTSSEELLVEVCKKARKENGHYSDFGRGYVMVKLSDDIAVKIGGLVTASEARTQEFANQNTDPTIVHVPRVYRFFERDDPPSSSKIGYLFMEYVQGPTLEEVDLDIRTNIIPRMAQIIVHLGQIQGGQVPGPIGGGLAQGHLFGDDGADVIFTSVSGFNTYLNKRLAIAKKTIDLSGHPLVLCHLDLGRRNVILGDDDTISLVNWNDAGLYPRLFEVRVLSYVNYRCGPFDTPLEEAIKTLLGLTEEETRLMDLLRIVRSVNLRAQLRETYLLRYGGHPLTKIKDTRYGSYLVLKGFQNTKYGDCAVIRGYSSPLLVSVRRVPIGVYTVMMYGYARATPHLSQKDYSIPARPEYA